MKDLMRATSAGIIAYRIAILYGCLFSANSLLDAFIIGFLNVSWSQLDTTSKLLLRAAIAKNWTSTMLAYCSKAVANAARGRLPMALDTGDTREFSLRQTTITAQTPAETTKT